MGPSTEACGHMSTLTMGWCLLRFGPPRRRPRVQPRKPPLTSGVFSLPFISLPQQSSASATSFVLGVSGGKETSILLCLKNTSCPAQGGICLLPQNDLHLTEPASDAPLTCLWDLESSVSAHPWDRNSSLSYSLSFRSMGKAWLQAHSC